MSDALAFAPSPSRATPAPPQIQPYPERPDLRLHPLDEHAARLVAHLKYWGARPRLRRLAGIVPLVDRLEADIRPLDLPALVARARRAGARLRGKGTFPAPDTAECFAVIRELSRRHNGRRHYGVQMLGAYAMLRGQLAQMATGEGKTLTAALAAATAALAGEPVHVVTVNDYLAERDAEITRPIYELLGLSVGIVISGMEFEQRRSAYRCDITYCTNKELAFDYLRDRMVLGQDRGTLRLRLESIGTGEGRSGRLRLRGLHFAIVDEADSVLVDEARTPLILSAPAAGQITAETANEALALARSLREGIDYLNFPTQKRVHLTATGRDAIASFAAASGEAWRGVVVREEYARQALSALHFFHRDQQYIIRDDKVQIVDEQTGRVMPDRAWSDGLHQMIEVKEGVDPSARRVTIARMTYQRLFRRYRHLSGMTGTAMQVARELWSVYRLPVVTIPTHRPRQRIDRPDRVLPDDERKWTAVVERVSVLHRKGAPVLIGTRSVASSLEAGARLAAAGLPHRILNAAQDKDEAEIIAAAGDRGRITVVTNMAGRGTDIHIADDIEALGGLHVVMIERHEARRIDDQLAGRAGRQGQRGSFEAILSLDDALLEFAAIPGLRQICGMLHPLIGEGPSRWLLRHVQKRAERIHARMRRDLLRSDSNQIKTLAFSGRPE